MMNNLTSELMTKLKKTEKEAEDTRLSLERGTASSQEIRVFFASHILTLID